MLARYPRLGANLIIRARPSAPGPDISPTSCCGRQSARCDKAYSLKTLQRSSTTCCAPQSLLRLQAGQAIQGLPARRDEAPPALRLSPARPSASLGPCALSQRHLDALATKVGEISGLGRHAERGRPCMGGQPFRLCKNHRRRPPSRRAAASEHRNHVHAFLEIVDPERRGEPRRPAGRQHVVRPRAVVAEHLGRNGSRGTPHPRGGPAPRGPRGRPRTAPGAPEPRSSRPRPRLLEVANQHERAVALERRPG